MNIGKGVMDSGGKEASRRQPWKGNGWPDRQEASRREARQVVACAVWVSAFWLLQGADIPDESAYYYQTIIFSACGFSAISSCKTCSAIVGALSGLLLAIVAVGATGDIVLADMIVSCGLCVYAGFMAFRVASALGWIAACAVNVLATSSGWYDIPMDYAALTVWAFVVFAMVSNARDRAKRLKHIHRRRNHLRALREEKNRAIFDAIHGMANAFNAAQYVAGVKMPPEKQEIMERAILRFHEEKTKIVGKRPTSIIEFMRKAADGWRQNKK